MVGRTHKGERQRSDGRERAKSNGQGLDKHTAEYCQELLTKGLLHSNYCAIVSLRPLQDIHHNAVQELISFYR